MTIRREKKKKKRQKSFYKLPLFVNYVQQNLGIQEKTKVPIKKGEVREN